MALSASRKYDTLLSDLLREVDWSSYSFPSSSATGRGDTDGGNGTDENAPR